MNFAASFHVASASNFRFVEDALGFRWNEASVPVGGGICKTADVERARNNNRFPWVKTSKHSMRTCTLYPLVKRESVLYRPRSAFSSAGATERLRFRHVGLGKVRLPMGLDRIDERVRRRQVDVFERLGAN